MKEDVFKRKYYEAYDDRYRQVHSQNLQWFYDDPTPIVMETIKKFGIGYSHNILELGCGEGRDAYPLLKQGYKVSATDISTAAMVDEADRDAFYTFIREHLNPEGIALICTMGDGTMERQTDISTAFELQKRTHEQSGKEVQIANTSCRIVSFDRFRRELERNGLLIVEEGITSALPDFSMLMYAMCRR